MTRRHHLGAAVLALVAGLSMVAPAQAEPGPTALYPLTAGTVGNYTYDVQVGPGIGLLDERAFCTHVTMSHVTSTEPSVVDGCRRITRDKLVSGRTILENTGHFLAAGGDPIFTVDFFGTKPRAQRLKLFYDGRPSVTIRKSASRVLTIDGERVRFFYQASVSEDPRKPARAKAQKKSCRKVDGKKRCSWRTVADQPYILLP